MAVFGPFWAHFFTILDRFRAKLKPNQLILAYFAQFFAYFSLIMDQLRSNGTYTTYFSELWLILWQNMIQFDLFWLVWAIFGIFW